ncbi:MAG: hypothetical protein MRY74_02005 [Neomegalonema sp.]|nr:hypothetical protein [Neomegalonema sp.]
MFKTLFGSLLALFMLAAAPDAASAQEFDVKRYGSRWIQVSSHAYEADARASARRYSRRFADTRVFLSTSGYFAVVIGSAPTRIARVRLVRLRDDGAIPYDAYLTGGTRYLREVFF